MSFYPPLAKSPLFLVGLVPVVFSLGLVVGWLFLVGWLVGCGVFVGFFVVVALVLGVWFCFVAFCLAVWFGF